MVGKMKSKTVFSWRVCFLFFLLFTLVGCAQNRAATPAVYLHPAYGEVQLPDARYDADKLACKTAVYQRGILVDGISTTDLVVIDAYIKEAFSWYVRQIQASRSSKRAAAIGYSAGMAVSGINVPVMLSSDYGSEAPEMPEKYDDALLAHAELGRCVTDKGWKKAPTQSQ
ncbi:hypothetical protein SAMN02745866_02173 [Alteromonadaceae bacterium Bs31]|nr:hypothetical protein SAMN02745866_02173 [Alteromonadaceae bacterium Bs31]